MEMMMRNKKIKSQSAPTSIVALLLMAMAILACSFGDETDKANKLVDEGNAAVQDAKKNGIDGDEKKDKMAIASDSVKTQADLAAVKAVAREAISAYEKAAEKCNDAVKKYDEASKLKINEKFKQYLELKVKEFKQRAEVADASKGIPQALLDSDNRKDFITKGTAVKEKVAKLVKDADETASQAEKIQKDNKDVFKS